MAAGAVGYRTGAGAAGGVMGPASAGRDVHVCAGRIIRDIGRRGPGRWNCGRPRGASSRKASMSPCLCQRAR